MTKRHILGEVRRMAAANGGVRLGRDEANRKIRPKGADAVAAVDDFNLDPENVGKEDLVEKAYTMLEHAAEAVLEKIRAGDPRLSRMRKGLSYFIAFQKFRTTLNRDILNRGCIRHCVAPLYRVEHG